MSFICSHHELKGLTFWLSFVMLNCVFVTFPCGILVQVWYLIVSITEFCRLSYFALFAKANQPKGTYVHSKLNTATP